MLLYSNRNSLRLVFSFKGSVFLRLDSLAFGAAAAVAAVIMQVARESGHLRLDLPHHFGMLALGAILGLIVTFRAAQGWARYWESLTELHAMYSKWSDAFAELFAFASVAVDACAKNEDSEEAERQCRVIEELLIKLLDNFVLLSALASHRLTHGDIQRMDVRARQADWSEQVAYRDSLRREDLTGAARMPKLTAMSTRWSPVQHEQSRRATDKLYDTMSGMSSACLTGKNVWYDDSYVVNNLPSSAELSLLRRSTDRVTVVMYWIIFDLAKLSPSLNTPTPIQSRMYQELSNGMLAFNQCLKLADIPFPFPYAQMVTIVITAFMFFVPIYIVSFTGTHLASPILSFTLTAGTWGLNEVAKEMEVPFGHSDNHVLVSDFHIRFIDMCNTVYEAHMCKVGMLYLGGHGSDTWSVCSPRLVRPSSSMVFGTMNSTSVGDVAADDTDRDSQVSGDSEPLENDSVEAVSTSDVVINETVDPLFLLTRRGVTL
mmetsp:Transcript_60736/g.131662  ORF Transcript_60736/g.131662 Transcript_60736/m.131662 type:complete len:488 (+) Transcript_60736:145-1608(+)